MQVNWKQQCRFSPLIATFTSSDAECAARRIAGRLAEPAAMRSCLVQRELMRDKVVQLPPGEHAHTSFWPYRPLSLCGGRVRERAKQLPKEFLELPKLCWRQIGKCRRNG